jgi:hypothetical protein
MTFFEALTVALISAPVSLLVAIAFRWWEKRAVRWVVTGEAYVEYQSGMPTGANIAKLQVHNAGDADAYNVRLTRCNGGEFSSWETFEVGRLAPGENFPVTVSAIPENWETAWIEIIYQPTPVHRRKPTRSRRYLVALIVGCVHPEPPSKQPIDPGRGHNRWLRSDQ